MQKIQIQLADVRYDADLQQYEARAVLTGTAELTLNVTARTPVQTDLEKVFRMLTLNAVVAYKKILPKKDNTPVVVEHQPVPQPQIAAPRYLH
ncbi:MAG: hypothetical protein AB8B51_12775 [Sedimentitalea sp.]